MPHLSERLLQDALPHALADRRILSRRQPAHPEGEEQRRGGFWNRTHGRLTRERHSLAFVAPAVLPIVACVWRSPSIARLALDGTALSPSATKLPNSPGAAARLGSISTK